MSIMNVNLLAVTLLLAAFLAPHGSTSLPWTFPGDFRERLRMSALVVSGTIEETFRTGSRTVDGTEVTAHAAHVRVDRVFQGNAAGEKLRFAWFTLRMTTTGRGFIYSGPPLADFRPNKRYLIFLKRTRSGWEASMPLYAIEEELAAKPPHGALRDLSQVPLQQRYEALAEELENAALAQPVPPPGMTGEAATYFPSVFDLLGGCAEPFYRRFLSSPNKRVWHQAEAAKADLWFVLPEVFYNAVQTAHITVELLQSIGLVILDEYDSFSIGVIRAEGEHLRFSKHFEHFLEIFEKSDRRYLLMSATPARRSRLEGQ